jgi:hypothetical protein
MDLKCNMLQMIETLKGILWSVKHHDDVLIAIGAFAHMDRLPDFDDMAAHPILLVPQKIIVDEDASLPYFPNLVDAAPGELNATPVVMAHNIPFDEIQAHIALHIFSHSIKISSDQLDPYDIPNDMFAIPKLYLRSVHHNHPVKKTKPACSPWKSVSSVVC